MRKRRFLLLCSAFLLFLAGCSLAGSGTEQIKPLESVTLFSDVDFWDLPDWSLEEGSISAEISNRTSLIIDSSIPPQDAARILSLRILEDDLPDIMVLADTGLAGQLVASGKVWDLEELLTRYCPASHLLSRFPEDMKRELIRRDGGWYAYPSHINSLDAKEIWHCQDMYYDKVDRCSSTLAVIWNRKLLNELGLDGQDVQTAPQVMDAFQKAASQHPFQEGSGILPLLFDGNLYQEYSLPVLNNSFGAEYVDKNGRYTNRWLQPEAKETLAFANRALRSGYARAEDLSANNTAIKAVMASGQVLCFIGNTANAGINPSEWVSFGPILSGLGTRPVFGKDLQMAGGWLNTLVSKSCSCPEKIAKWLDYMSSDEGMLINNYGFEGMDYTWRPDGALTPTAEGEKKRESYAATGYSAWWNFGNIAWERSILPLPDESSDSFQKDLLECALGSYPDTYVFDMALLTPPNGFPSEGSELWQIQKEVDAFQKDQIAKIITAETDLEFESEYGYFLSHLKELGIGTLDEAIHSKYQENCSFYGKTIEKVN